MIIICPYCDIEINDKLVEAEDGCCPECGALITAGNAISDDEEEFESEEDGFSDEYDDALDENDQYDDLDDLDDDDFKDEDDY